MELARAWYVDRAVKSIGIGWEPRAVRVCLGKKKKKVAHISPAMLTTLPTRHGCLFPSQDGQDP